MEKYDKICGSVLFLFALAVFIRSFSFGLGTLTTPESGVFPILAAVPLMILSATIVVNSCLKKGSVEGKYVNFFPAKDTPQRIFLTLLGLVAFRYLFSLIGFAPTAFVFIFFMSRFLSYQKLLVNFVFAGFTAVVSYYLFQIWLNIPMPTGIFGI
jgi:hypothetical protein